jgi:uncharacterized membrane protein HdeD (DUF308 family)
LVHAPAEWNGRPQRALHKEAKIMIVLGLILLILGLVLAESILTTIGIILLVVGLVLNFVPIGGSARRVW